MVHADHTEYKEIHRLDDMFLYVLFAGLCVVNMMVYRYFLIHDLSVFTMSVVSFIFFTVLYFVIRLEIIYQDEGIRIRYFPFQPKGKWIAKSDILFAEWIDVRPLKNFGGYGYRNKTEYEVYILRGKKAVKFRLKTQKKFLVLGTINREKIERNLKNELKNIESGFL